MPGIKLSVNKYSGTVENMEDNRMKIFLKVASEVHQKVCFFHEQKIYL
jgi:hypothetical protein